LYTSEEKHDQEHRPDEAHDVPTTGYEHQMDERRQYTIMELLDLLEIAQSAQKWHGNASANRSFALHGKNQYDFEECFDEALNASFW